MCALLPLFIGKVPTDSIQFTMVKGQDPPFRGEQSIYVQGFILGVGKDSSGGRNCPACLVSRL